LRPLPTEIPATGNRIEVAALEVTAPMQIGQPGLTEGYRLVGAEVTEIDGHAAVRLGFRSADGRTLSLFWATVSDDTAYLVQLYDGNTNRAAYWFEGRVMWILADAEQGDLAAMAEDVHRGAPLWPLTDLQILAEEPHLDRPPGAPQMAEP